MRLMIHTLSQQTNADPVIISTVAVVIAAVLTAVLIRIKNAVVVILFSPLEKHLCPLGSGFIEVDIQHLGYIVFGVEYLVLGVIMAVIIYRIGKAE